MNIALRLAFILVLAGCAQMPAEIAPSKPSEDYSRLDCSEVEANLRSESSHLEEMTATQTKRANADKISVMLVLIPVSALTKQDQAAEIAVSKGRVAALESRMALCS